MRGLLTQVKRTLFAETGGGRARAPGHSLCSSAKYPKLYAHPCSLPSPGTQALAGRGGREQQSALAAGGLSGSLNNDGQIIQSLSDSLRSDTDLPDPETFVPPTPPTGDL